MIVRNKIWEEIKDADVLYRCAIEYASVQRQIVVFYKIAIPVLAALCALFTKMEMPNYTFCSAMLIFVSSILKTFFTQIILPDRDIEKLDKLGVAFESYRVKDENLMDELDNDKIADEDAIKELNKHNSDYCKRKTELNKLILWIPFWIKKRLRMSSEEYLLRVHHNQYR